MPSLFVIQGQDQGKRFDLDRICTTIGRDTVNKIRLNDSEVSRAHAEIRQDDLGESYYLTDLGSSNGTYVNGKLIERHVLLSGDRVQFGSSLMLYTGSDVGDDAKAFADNVDIVPADDQASQIISSLPHDENSQFFYGDSSDQDSPWLARARSNLQVMYRTALAVSHTLDIDELLARIMELIFEWVEADRGCILLKDRTTEELLPRARQNRPGVDDEKLTISKTILDYVLTNSEGVLTSDARDDDRFDDAGSIVKAGVREAIGVPMQGRYGVVGVIYIDTYTPPGEWSDGNSKKFNDEHLKMMIAIAHQAALAVEDTAYYSAMLQSERLAAIGQTIAGLSHHVKNILQGIRGGSYLIEEGLNATETDLIRTGWGIVEKNQEKISRLVLDMLTFSKEREPEVDDADLHETVNEVIELMTVRAADCGVAIEFEPDPNLPTLRFDQEGVHHALLNVVTNAVDACEAAWIALDHALEIASEDPVTEDLAVEVKSLDEEALDDVELDEEASEEEQAEWAQGSDETFELEEEVKSEEEINSEVQRTADEAEQSLEKFAKSVKEDNEESNDEWLADVIEDTADNESDEAESDEAESDEAESDEAESDEAESDEAESDEAESDEAESDEAESDEAESDEAESDEAESDEAELDEAELDNETSGEIESNDEDHEKAASEEIAEEDFEISEDELIVVDETPEPGSRGMVSISTHYLEEERRVEIRVKDNGEGINEQDLKQIFVVFNSSKGNRGTGLGLSVSQKILHEHGGDILVTSKRGTGSTFTLALPAIPAQESDKDGEEGNASDDQADVTDQGIEDGSTAAP